MTSSTPHTNILAVSLKIWNSAEFHLIPYRYEVIFRMKKFFAILIVILAIPQVCNAVDISARSACLIVASSGEIVYEKEPHLKAPMASTTKMMTALVAAESDKWEEIATVSVNAQNQEGSKIYLAAGDEMKLSDLVCGMMLNSGNDAAMAVAEHISGSCESFAVLMTKRARELGAEDTSFKNPNGLDAEGHHSTAYDLALIGREVIENEKLSDIVSCREMKVESTSGTVTYLRNHNKLLWNYDGTIGVKTGFTKASGRCLVSAAERDGVTLIAVTLNAPDDWNDHKKLFDYGFDVCDTERVIEKREELARVRIGGKVLGFEAGADVMAVNVHGQKDDCEVVLHRIKAPQAPIAKGEKLGVAEVLQNGRHIAEVDLVASCDVYAGEEKESFLERVFDWIDDLI